MSTVIICNGVWVQKIPPAFRQAHIPCEVTDLKLQDAVGQQTHAFLSGKVLTVGGSNSPFITCLRKVTPVCLN
jgi:hypothetical protein